MQEIFFVSAIELLVYFLIGTLIAEWYEAELLAFIKRGGALLPKKVEAISNRMIYGWLWLLPCERIKGLGPWKK
ncbi:MAG: hypothetical protein CO002_00550 [Candidatus Portnoybacteria bacterium CG_4_8_14_3_um_filter_44_10]|uniref:Uncharacterized protein n=5 Tax=Candidatus Portnoyibacteriota TaxID=1817913 RepID=A0A2H0KRK7_9BACT|nr:MAG: hypothetical protein AUK17_01920 [Parcubacteria group bacterium CG2_30_44_18]PIQ74793.1 MAG: hypothetical protein COV85_00085 [Candidatus Portnoybacteria bacterium CG11_big_fil_rev_8_21_14_0_20_44_10]PIW75696.1 MAG: hypothetical protein CO002_00550 [Candidatus Portnoybacteria bacterium CG_4_8_14_3_um_filter_44_10]PIZ70197.1 MAG: hypothetical protein COY11_03015 [Candidatus Portnoybacteria bacterium CG_4_10_14_0_2_um_filter_44_20]PJA63266.1 MAG: hypothetical protein CO161_01925 [Candidat